MLKLRVRQPRGRGRFVADGAGAALAGLLALTAVIGTRVEAQVAPPPASAGAGAAAARLSLADALLEADARAFENRLARAASHGADAGARLPLAGILPTLRVEAGALRTTDPIGAFGTTLRQRRITAEAFDPAQLNNPAAVTNALGGLVLEVPLLNLDAYTGWKAARASADAATAREDWTRLSIRVEVVRAYYGAVLAQEKISTLEQTYAAAQSAVRQVNAMVRQGLVTTADALQASVRSSDVQTALLSARHDGTTARQQLAVLLGRRDGSSPTLPDALPGDAVVRALARQALDGSNAGRDEQRADLRAAERGVDAARSDRQRAASTLLPRLNGFARYDWNSPTTLFDGRKNWTVGVMGSWTVFGGNRELADLSGANARLDGARAQLDAASAQRVLDADISRRTLNLALERLDLATQASAQSREAVRLVEKRYAGGLVTIAEMLSVEAMATASALAVAGARYALIEAIATRARAVGADPAQLTMLDAHERHRPPDSDTSR